MSTTFYRGENPLHADKLNTAFSERVSRGGDTMQGFLTLAADPVQPFDAATKQYVDRFTAMGVPTGAYIGASPPGNTLAPLWWDNVSGQLFIQYNDGSSTQWVSANSTVTTGGASGLFLPLTGGTITGPLVVNAPISGTAFGTGIGQVPVFTNNGSGLPSLQTSNRLMFFRTTPAANDSVDFHFLRQTAFTGGAGTTNNILLVESIFRRWGMPAVITASCPFCLQTAHPALQIPLCMRKPIRMVGSTASVWAARRRSLTRATRPDYQHRQPVGKLPRRTSSTSVRTKLTMQLMATSSVEWACVALSALSSAVLTRPIRRPWNSPMRSGYIPTLSVGLAPILLPS